MREFGSNKLPPVAASYQFTPRFTLAVTDKKGMVWLVQIVKLPLLVGGFGDGKKETVKMSDNVEQKLLFKLAISCATLVL